MASRKPVIHGNDHLPGGADPIKFLFPTSRYSNEIINDPAGGLVLYWKLDELGNTTTDAIDSSGNGHTGTYGVAGGSGSTAGTVPTLGVAALADGTAASFDGVTDNVGIDGAVAGIQRFGQMSIECWVKTSQSVALDSGHSLNTNVGVLVESDTGSSDGRFFSLTLDFATGVIGYEIFGTDATGHALSGAAVVNDGVAHHVVATFDGTDMNIYVDGVLDATDTPSMGGFPLADHNGGIWVGSGYPQLGNTVLHSHLNAVLDEIALYTIALPLSSVQTHQLVGATASNPPGGPAGGDDITGNYPDDLSLTDTGVAAGTYGDSTHVGQFTVDAKGRISAASDVAVSVAVSADDVSITDSGGYFTSSDVEGALQELGAGGGGGGGGGVFSGACVHRTANVTVNNTSNNGIVPFDSNSTEEYDTDGYHDPATNPSRLTVPATGYYRVTGGGAPTAATNYAARIYVNGTFVAQAGSNSNSDGATVTRTLHLTAGDYVELGSFTFNTNATLTSGQSCFLQIELLG